MKETRMRVPVQPAHAAGRLDDHDSAQGCPAETAEAGLASGASQAYLDRVVAQLRVSAGQAGMIREELADHIADRIADCRSRRLPGDAEALVLAELGDPRQLARLLSRVHAQRGRRGWTLAWAGLGVAASLVMALGWPGWMTMNMRLDPAAVQIEHNMQAGKGQVMRTAGMMSAMVGGLLVAGTAQVQAVPTVINHQGVIAVNGVRHSGTGYFKFALLDDGGSQVWTNDGTAQPTGEPSAALTVPVADGVYSVRLGDTGQPALTTTLFADHDDLKLRIWFSHTGAAGSYQPLTPEHDLASVPYAMRAASAAMVDNGAITTDKLADHAVTAGKIDSSIPLWSKVDTTKIKFDGGYVGIGNTASPAATLHVARVGTSAAHALRVYSDQSSGYAALYLETSHNVNGSRYHILAHTGGSSNIDAFWVDHYGNVHAQANVSAASFTDRTPYPADLKTAYDAVRSMKRLPDGQYHPGNKAHQLDHATLHPFVTSPDGESRDLSATVSVQNEVLKDLIARVERIDGRTMLADARPSSRELKQEIQTLPSNEALATLHALNPVAYRFRQSSADRHLGFIAEDVPEAVATPDRRAVDTMDIVAVLTKVVQEQQSAIQALRARDADVVSMREELASLRAELAALRGAN